jgi:hypothetical protein
MLFDELDIEKQLSSRWPEQTLLLTNEGEDSDEEPGFFSNAWDTVVTGATYAGAGISAAAGTAIDIVEAPFAVAGAYFSDEDTTLKEAIEVTREDYVQDMVTRVNDFQEAVEDPKAQAADRKSRWQDQCFLIEGWKTIVDKFKVCDQAVKKSGYSHVIPVLSNSSEVVSILADRANANLFFTLSPAQLSMLVPSIRLFIIKYKEETNESGKKIIIEDDSPLELFLDDYTESKLVQDIMIGKKGRAEAIGLNSFTYEFDGTDPATTNSLIKANISLLFNSFEKLTDVQPNGAKFLDLLLRTKKMVKQTRDDKIAKDKDNIYNYCKEGAADRAKKNETDGVTRLNPEYRRIRASVGWALPSGNLFFELFPPDVQGKATPEFRKKVTNLLTSLRLDMFLEMTDYDLNFANDGRIELKIDYRGAIEGELNEEEANIFFQLKNRNKRIEKYRSDAAIETKKKRKKQIDEIKGKNLEQDEEKDALKDIGKQSAAATRFYERNAADQVYRNKLFWYSRFLDHLETTHKLIRIEITKESLELWRGNRQFDAPGQGNTENTTEAGEEASDSNSDDASVNSGGISAGEILKNIFDGNGAMTLHGTYGEVNDGKSIKFNPATLEGKEISSRSLNGLKNTLEKEADPNNATRRSEDTIPDQQKNSQKEVQRAANRNYDNTLSGPGNRNIYFTFLGDILDTAMNFVNVENRKNSTHKSTIRLLTSQITFTDPYSSLDGRNQAEIMNIADIPVSLDEFISWFNDKVIKRGVTDYPILDFIKDAITDLAVRAFGYNCTGKEQFVPVLNYTVFDLPKLQNKREPLEPGRRYNTLKPIREVKKKLAPTFRKSPREIVNYLIVHGSARTFINRNSSDLEQDERDGIYHFGIGLDRGILKEINFSSQKLAYGPETRIIDQNVAGIRQLFRKFDANVTLYGCPIFRNGQYLFLDPRTMGVGSDISRAMGLGGYYNIYNVYGKLDRSNYVVELKCNYQGSGLCGTQTVDRSRNLCSQETIDVIEKRRELLEETKKIVEEQGGQALKDAMSTADETDFQEAAEAAVAAENAPENPALEIPEGATSTGELPKVEATPYPEGANPFIDGGLE